MSQPPLTIAPPTPMNTSGNITINNTNNQSQPPTPTTPNVNNTPLLPMAILPIEETISEIRGCVLHTITSIQNTLQNWKIDLARVHASNKTGTRFRIISRCIMEIRMLVDPWPSIRDSVFVSRISTLNDDEVGDFVYAIRCLELYIWDSLSRLEFLRRWILNSTNFATTFTVLTVVRGIKLSVGSYYEEILQERGKIDTPENEKDKKKQAKRRGGRKKRTNNNIEEDN